MALNYPPNPVDTELYPIDPLPGEEQFQWNEEHEMWRRVARLEVLTGFKNQIINGAFDVWQRGTSFSTNNVYTADRWIAVANSGSPTVTRGDNTFPTGSKYMYVLSGNIPYLEQRIEDYSQFVEGDEWTFSFWHTSATAPQLQIRPSDGSGTGLVSAVNISGDKWKYTFTIGAATAAPAYYEVRVYNAGNIGELQ